MKALIPYVSRLLLILLAAFLMSGCRMLLSPFYPEREKTLTTKPTADNIINDAADDIVQVRQVLADGAIMVDVDSMPEGVELTEVDMSVPDRTVLTFTNTLAQANPSAKTNATGRALSADEWTEFINRVTSAQTLLLGSATYLGYQMTVGELVDAYQLIGGQIEQIEQLENMLRITLVNKPAIECVKEFHLDHIRKVFEAGSVQFPNEIKIIDKEKNLDFSVAIRGKVSWGHTVLESVADEDAGTLRFSLSTNISCDLTIGGQSDFALWPPGVQNEITIPLPTLWYGIPGKVASIGLELFVRVEPIAHGGGEFTVSFSDSVKIERNVNMNTGEMTVVGTDDPLEVSFQQWSLDESGWFGLKVKGTGGLGFRISALGEKLIALDVGAGIEVDAGIRSIGGTGTEPFYNVTGFSELKFVCDFTVIESGPCYEVILFKPEMRLIPATDGPLLSGYLDVNGPKLTITKTYPGSSRYKIERRSGEAGFVEVADIPLNSGDLTEWTDPSAAEGVCYYRVRVQLQGLPFYSDYSPVVGINVPPPDGGTTYVIKTDDGTCEERSSWAGSLDSVYGAVSDGRYGWYIILEPPHYPFSITSVSLYFTSRNSDNKGFYLHLWDEHGTNLLPTPMLIPSSDVASINAWWSKDVSSHSIIINSGKIRVGFCESYLPWGSDHYGIPKSGWGIGVDSNNIGNCYMIMYPNYPNGVYDKWQGGNLMLRIQGITTS